MKELISALCVTVLLWTLALSVPLQTAEDNQYGATNSRQCAETYHGKCIDTFKFQCMGINIPGICDNLTHFVSTENRFTRVQCCNGWQVIPLSGQVVVTDNPGLPDVG